MPTPWRKGPPPCRGWWNASVERNETLRRWWNGRAWSRPVSLGASDAACARIKRIVANDISPDVCEWRGQTDAEARRRTS